MSETKTINLNIYVIHVEQFKFRKATCEKLKDILEADERYKLNFKYITEYDPQNITQDEIRQFVNYEQIKDEGLAPFNVFIKNIHINQLSNALKHMKALQYINEDDEVDYYIILEDDIVFNDNVADILYDCLSKTPEDYDLLFLGLPSSKDVKGDNYQSVSDVFKVLPCCDSYLITKTAATSIFESFVPVKFSNNIQLSYIIAKNSLKSYLSVPNVFIDGSKLGLYFSSIETNNRLIFNQDYVSLAKLIGEKDTFDEEEMKVIDEAFMQVKLKTNPEMYYLKGLYEIKRQNYEFAKAIYEYTYDLYNANGAVLNNQSTFLRDYMKVFKYLQEDIPAV
jgi:GR25 family glycosyltransferase involved in LPS biosynthesis